MLTRDYDTLKHGSSSPGGSMQCEIQSLQKSPHYDIF